MKKLEYVVGISQRAGTVWGVPQDVRSRECENIFNPSHDIAVRVQHRYSFNQ